MNDAESQAQGEASSRAAGEPERSRPSPGWEPNKDKKRSPSRAIVIAVIGAVATAGVVAAVLYPELIGGSAGPTGSGAESVLEALAPADIDAALPTLDPAASKAAVEDAKACKAPLAWVSLMQQPGGHGGMVRIRSGSYLSPPIQLTPARQRIAIPYPAPYPSGRGVLSLVGEADRVAFQLTPGVVAQNVTGTYSVNVHWVVRKPCP
jgi:hypothetical protein